MERKVHYERRQEIAICFLHSLCICSFPIHAGKCTGKSVAFSGSSSGRVSCYGVVNHQNEELGNLDDIMLDLQGTVQYAVISYGGFLGVGDNLVAIPRRAIQIDQENRKVVINVTKDQLEKAPRFNPVTLPDMNDSQWREQNQKFFRSRLMLLKP